MNKIFILFLLFSAFNHGISQDILMSESEISETSKGLFQKLERFENNPKKKKRREKFINEYNKVIGEYTHQFNSGKESSLGKNWEKMLNSLKVLQNINSRVKESKAAKSLVEIKDYNSQIESISLEATAFLYEKGKSVIEKKENEFACQNGYEFFYRANQISPNYQDSKALMEMAAKKGNKVVSFQPIEPYRSNSSNQMLIQFGDVNNYIVEKLMNDISINMVGSQLVDNQNLGADWIIEIEWKSISTPPERKTDMKYKRTKQISENGENKEVTADVTYNTTHKDINGTIVCKVKNNKGENDILIKDIMGFTSSQEVKVSYTGDKRALTTEDLNHINKPFVYTGNDTNKLIQKLYEEQIHPQLLDELGYLLNWNYRFNKD